MPWNAKTFAARHNKKLSGTEATKAAKMANAMLDRGVPEGEAIATANKRARAPGFRGRKTRRYTGA
jgi:uncharacterized protein YdaT